MDGQPVPPPAPGSEPTLGMRLLLTVWAGDAGRWTARAELADGSAQVFDSPFELARFVARMTPRPPTPPSGAPAGLR